MAIPFAFPSDEDTEANYQRLDQLLSDLFEVLQQILLTQRRIRDAQPSQLAHRMRSARRHDGPEPPSPPPEPPRAAADFALPASPSSSAAGDLLRFDAGRAARRCRRRRRTSSESSCCESKPAQAATMPPAQDWTQEEAQQNEESKRPCGVDTSPSPADPSLLSMFVPPPFGGSIWTAVIFVVGWRLLARAR